ncbi:hypothetical protein CapIbe_013275 [Capra ibex]
MGAGNGREQSDTHSVHRAPSVYTPLRTGQWKSKQELRRRRWSLNTSSFHPPLVGHPSTCPPPGLQLPEAEVSLGERQQAWG